MKGSTRFKVALWAQLALLIYFELCVLVPLGPWNAQGGNSGPGLSPGNLILGGVIGVAQLALFLGTFWRSKPLLWIGLVCDSLWFLSHLQGLWAPYFFGASPQYASMYTRVFSRTTKLLPSFGNHLAPDAMHIILDAFLLAVIITLIVCLASLRAASFPSRGDVYPRVAAPKQCE